MGLPLSEWRVRVHADPEVELFVAATPGDAEQTLLVIHGGPDWDHTYLREPLVHLGGHHRVVFVDLRGCGRSTRGLPAIDYTPMAVVRDLVALIDHLGTEPVDVVGFSYGGQLVQRLIVTVPERVRRAIIASSSILPVAPEAFTGWTARDERIAAQPPVTGYADTAYDDQRTRLEAVNSAVTNLWRLDLLPEYLARLEQVHFSSDWSRAWPDHSLLPPSRPDNAPKRLRALGTPILLLHGRQDMTFPATTIEPTLSLIPNAQAVVLDQAGHMAHIDQADAWLNAIRDFLQ